MDAERDPAMESKSRSGVAHWRYQRYTAILLVPLCLWLMISVMRGVGQGYSAAIEWLQSPIIAGLFIVGFMALYLHAMLGIQAVVEDYVTDVGRQEILVLTVRGVTLAITAISVVAVLVVTMS